MITAVSFANPIVNKNTNRQSYCIQKPGNISFKSKIVHNFVTIATFAVAAVVAGMANVLEFKNAPFRDLVGATGDMIQDHKTAMGYGALAIILGIAGVTFLLASPKEKK